MRIIVVGPGRAAISLATAFNNAGHQIVGLLGRGDPTPQIEALGADWLAWDAPLPSADLLLLGVRDDAIAEVAARLAPVAGNVTAAVHLSGSLTISVLEPLAGAGLSIGGFHPLQSLPDPAVGAKRLPGSWAGITADSPETAHQLFKLAESIEMFPFELADEVRPLYHAGASVAANYLVANLALAQRLFAGAGVPWEAARPLVEAATENLDQLGPEAALTGPIARGDVDTVRGQLTAIRRAVPESEQDFIDIGKAVARLAGREDEFEEVWE